MNNTVTKKENVMRNKYNRSAQFKKYLLKGGYFFLKKNHPLMVLVSLVQCQSEIFLGSSFFFVTERV